MSEEKKNQSKGKGGKAALAVCVVIIIVLLGVTIYLLVSRQKEDEPVNRNIVVNENNVEEVLAELEQRQPVPVGYYETIMNSTWNFAAGDAVSDNAYVENAEGNTNPVYFDVTLADTGETIYESPILPVGSHLDNIKLDTSLPEGTYDSILTYHLLDEENRSISTLKVTVTINIGQ